MSITFDFMFRQFGFVDKCLCTGFTVKWTVVNVLCNVIPQNMFFNTFVTKTANNQTQFHLFNLICNYLKITKRSNRKFTWRSQNGFFVWIITFRHFFVLGHCSNRHWLNSSSFFGCWMPTDNFLLIYWGSGRRSNNRFWLRCSVCMF